ncbi:MULTISPECIES: response regulator transcription factor [Corynebacterium]|uniref:Transcriptional regulatory protein WalR n=1 Tax=Corynebacterium provencense TaxID=1737425 RepID=A0A2Z3YRI8_9CORY|nr:MULTISPECIES: response regulator transcription factor [Corynebacterium]AWT26909.1 Transcriptional regulatory protein WalR [Corynebacterium provencense]MCI1255083.1 response regulator transcription factor [Corynebacterium provencense]
MKLTVLSDKDDISEVLPSLALLSHETVLLPATATSVREVGDADIVLIDVTGRNLLGIRDLCRSVAAAYPTLPVAVSIEETSVIALDGSWAVDDFILPVASPTEVDARLRMLMTRRPVPVEEAEDSQVASIGGLIVDEVTYVARVEGRPLDLTYKEFELLYFLVKHAGRVFSREQLLQDVWGYDYFGGTRTVDVHVRRLRAKLGHDYEKVIATVRNVGYKAVDISAEGR